MRRRSTSRPLVLVAGLAAAVPVIVSTIHAVAVGWIPLGDEAVIAARSYDVFTTHPPLLGQFSASSAVLGHDTHSLGPLEYWLLALPVRTGVSWAPALVTGLVNTAAVMGTVALAHRRGGRALMLAVAGGLVVALASLAQETYHSTWNPSVALLPFALLIFVAWSLACGEYRLLPLAALVASFVVQCHLAYVLPTLGLVAVALAGLALERRGEWRTVRAWALAALAVLVVCWSAPLVEEAIHRPGNLELVARSSLAGEPRLGAAVGWHAVVRGIGVPPWWARTPRQGLASLFDLQAAPAVASTASAVLLLAGLVGVFVIAWRRQRRDIAFGAMVSLALCAALGLVAADTPSSGILFISVGYTLRWASFAGMFVWVFLAWAAVSLLTAGRRVPELARGAAVVAAGVTVVAAGGGVVAARGGPDRLQGVYRPVERAAARVNAMVPHDHTVRVLGTGAPDVNGFDIPAGTVSALRRDGRRVQAPGLDQLLGSRYKGGARAYDDLIQVYVPGGQPPPLGLVAGRVGPVTIVVVRGRDR